MEEVFCSHAVVHPHPYDFSKKGLAGIVPILFQHIVAAAGYADPNQALFMLDHYRNEMQNFEAQGEAMITQAFQNISFNEMGDWTLEKFLQYVARAEWVLRNVWQLPIELRQQGQEEITDDIPEEPPTLKQVGDELRQQGADPMVALSDMIREKPEYVQMPFIGGVKLLDNEEGLHYVREQIQKLPRGRHLPPTVFEE